MAVSSTTEFSLPSSLVKFSDGLLLASEIGGGDTSAIVVIDNVVNHLNRLIKKSQQTRR